MWSTLNLTVKITTIQTGLSPATVIPFYCAVCVCVCVNALVFEHANAWLRFDWACFSWNVQPLVEKSRSELHF